MPTGCFNLLLFSPDHANKTIVQLKTISIGNSMICSDIWPRGGGALPYMGYIGMCRCEGYGFQAVYSRIGYINQSVWV